MSAADGKWVVGYRPFAKPTPAFTVWRHRVDAAGLLQCDHMQDARTGSDALFTTKREAISAVRLITKQQLAIAA